MLLIHSLPVETSSVKSEEEKKICASQRIVMKFMWKTFTNKIVSWAREREEKSVGSHHKQWCYHKRLFGIKGGKTFTKTDKTGDAAASSVAALNR